MLILLSQNTGMRNPGIWSKFTLSQPHKEPRNLELETATNTSVAFAREIERTNKLNHQKKVAPK